MRVYAHQSCTRILIGSTLGILKIYKIPIFFPARMAYCVQTLWRFVNSNINPAKVFGVLRDSETIALIKVDQSSS